MGLHHSQEVLYPAFLRLSDGTERTEVIVLPSHVTRITITTPSCLRDMVVDDDSQSSVSQCPDDGGIDLQCAEPNEIFVRAQVIRIDDRVLANKLIRIWQADTIESQLTDDTCNAGSVPHI